MTQARLEQTPGYQFTRDQGLKAVQSAAAAGVGVSGSSLKGAGTYATAWRTRHTRTSAMSRSSGLVMCSTSTPRSRATCKAVRPLTDLGALGENAAAQTGVAGTSAAATGGNYLNQSGLDTAAGYTGANNAISGAANNYLALQAYNNRTNALQPTPTTTGYPQMTGFAPSVTEAQIRRLYRLVGTTHGRRPQRTAAGEPRIDVLQGIMNPAQVNPLAAITSGTGRRPSSTRARAAQQWRAAGDRVNRPVTKQFDPAATTRRSPPPAPRSRCMRSLLAGRLDAVADAAAQQHPKPGISRA